MLSNDFLSSSLFLRKLTKPKSQAVHHLVTSCFVSLFLLLPQEANHHHRLNFICCSNTQTHTHTHTRMNTYSVETAKAATFMNKLINYLRIPTIELESSFVAICCMFQIFVTCIFRSMIRLMSIKLAMTRMGKAKNKK